MKTVSLLFLCTWVWLFSWADAGAVTENDSLRLNKVESSIQKLDKKQDSTGRQLSVVVEAIAADSARCENICPLSTPIRGEGYYVLLLPFVLSLVFLVILVRALKGFNLADALTEKNPNKVQGFVALKNAEANAAVPFTEPAEPPTSEAPRSTSRLIAFISGIAAIVISISLTTFYMYYYLTIGAVPSEFKDLWWGVVVLGIGVIPYAAAQFVSHRTQPQQ